MLQALPHHNETNSDTEIDRKISNSGIITIVVFSVIAICVCVGAVYLLVRNKNISDVVEEIDDGECNCFGGMNSSSDKMVPKNTVSYEIFKVILILTLHVFQIDYEDNEIHLSKISSVMNKERD
jgi:hypothetical protein